MSCACKYYWLLDRDISRNSFISQKNVLNNNNATHFIQGRLIPNYVEPVPTMVTKLILYLLLHISLTSHLDSDIVHTIYIFWPVLLRRWSYNISSRKLRVISCRRRNGQSGIKLYCTQYLVDIKDICRGNVLTRDGVLEACGVSHQLNTRLVILNLQRFIYQIYFSVFKTKPNRKKNTVAI